MEWISVKDRLPEEGFWVLGTDGERVYLFQRPDQVISEYLKPYNKVKETTHWMPLPQPPKQVLPTPKGKKPCKNISFQ